MSRSPRTVWLSVGTRERTVRLWMGLLLAAWLAIQILSVLVCFGVLSDHQDDPLASYWHPAIVAVGIASLAIVFMVGGVGIASEQPWSWSLLLVAAAIQIVFTVATQIWEVTLPRGMIWTHVNSSEKYLGAVIGILLWNIVPIGILLLAIQGRKLARIYSQAQPAPTESAEPGALKPDH